MPIITTGLFLALLLLYLLRPLLLYTARWTVPLYHRWAIRRNAPQRKLYKYCRKQQKAKAVQDRLAAKDNWTNYKMLEARGADFWDYHQFRGAALDLRHSAMTVNCDKQKQRMLWMLCNQPYFRHIQTELGEYHE